MEIQVGATAMQFVSGLLFGSGFITAVVIFRVILHVSICG